MERRALYNSLRINWQLDPSLEVLPWQVEDYRKLTMKELFQRLSCFDIHLDQAHFLAFSEDVDTPEDLADLLLKDDVEDHETADAVYLLVFELWRRLIPEKQTLSLFCDELDHQIDLYDSGNLLSVEALEDSIAQILTLLADAEDQGGNKKALFQTILETSAHDVEGFIYDFISSQLEDHHVSYSLELTESFLPVVVDTRWFEFLNAKALAPSDLAASHRLIHKLIKEAVNDPELEFNLEVLSYLAQKGEERSFQQLVKQTLPLLQIEEDFSDLLASVEDYFHFKDREDKEQELISLRKKRSSINPEASFSQKDPDLLVIQRIFNG